MPSFRSLINLWPRPEDGARLALFAADLGVSVGHAQQMWRRDSIPPRYWLRLMVAASRRGIEGVDRALLADLAMARSAQKLAS